MKNSLEKAFINGCISYLVVHIFWIVVSMYEGYLVLTIKDVNGSIAVSNTPSSVLMQLLISFAYGALLTLACKKFIPNKQERPNPKDLKKGSIFIAIFISLTIFILPHGVYGTQLEFSLAEILIGLGITLLMQQLTLATAIIACKIAYKDDVEKINQTLNQK